MYCETFQEFKWQSRTTNLQLQRQRKKKEREKSVNKRRKHRLDITESPSAQFPTCIFNFGSYGHMGSLGQERKISIMKYV